MRAQSMKVAGCFLMIAMSSGTVIPPCNAAQLKPSDEASSATSDFSGAVDIGNGRKLHLECSGAGFPTVILESGLRTRGDNWSRTDLLSHGGAPVLQEAAKFVRVCTYDRPGTTLNPGEVSRSDAAPMPRTALNVVHDLHALLHAARRSGPVCAGRPFDGWIVHPAL